MDRAGHLDDGALVRTLDGQPVAGDEAGHLHDCAVCRARLRTLAGRSAGFTRAVAGTRAADPAPPPELWDRIQAAASAGPAEGAGVDLGRERERRAARGLRARRLPGSPLARAAVVVGVLLVGALVAEPVRAWIGSAIGRAVGALRGESEFEPAPFPAAADPGSAVAVSFVPAGDRLVIRVDEPQQAGTVRVVFEDRADAVGEVLTADETASLVVLPDGFRARNRADSDWSYRFRLPSSLRSVTVEVGGEEMAELTPAAGVAEVGLGRR